jgi:hypothetical protein
MKWKKFLAWLWVALCTLAIFLVVPLARTIQSFVQDRWGRSLFGYIVLVVAGGTYLILIYFLHFRLKTRSPSNYIWLTIIAGFYVYFTLQLWKVPVEAIHFLEYGLLGFLLFRAFRFAIKDKSIYLSAFLFGSLVGIFDEILQWMVPLRYWDIRDVGLNSLSAALFQIALWKGIAPKTISQKINPKSARILSVLLGMNLVLLGLCVSNTPKRVSSYTKLFPALSFLEKEESMSEFKQKHRDPEVGNFYSRLSLEELEKEDRENSDKYAQILKNSKDKDYGEFLRNFPGSIFPFLHELRVHLFRRDKKFEEGLNTERREEKRKLFFVAYKENLILEKYFGQTVQKSSDKWTEEKINQVEALINRNEPYTSPVSASLLSPSHEKMIWMAILAILILLAVLNYFFSRSRKLL